jgi:hypothetical protein
VTHHSSIPTTFPPEQPAELRTDDTRATLVPAPHVARATTAELGPDRATAARGSAGHTQPPRVRTRGTPNAEHPESPGDEPLRALIFAPEKTRESWIEGELSRLTVTIQVARRVRTVVAALIKDPPPRPQLLIVDFDAVSAAELLDLHAIRHEGWMGQLIGLGAVPVELRSSLGVEQVCPTPLVRDSLLDCIAGTRHAAVTLACPVIPPWDDPR